MRQASLSHGLTGRRRREVWRRSYLQGVVFTSDRAQQEEERRMEEEEEDHKKEEGGGEELPTRTDHECELSQMQEEMRGLMVLGRRQPWVGSMVGMGRRKEA